MNSFGKQEVLNFYIFSDQILVGKLGGRRDAPAFSRIDLQLIQVHGNYESPSDVRRRPSNGAASKSDKSDKPDVFVDADTDYDSDCSTSSKSDKKTNHTIVFLSPRESFLIFAR